MDRRQFVAAARSASRSPVPYATADEDMHCRYLVIRDGAGRELKWVVEADAVEGWYVAHDQHADGRLRIENGAPVLVRRHDAISIDFAPALRKSDGFERAAILDGYVSSCAGVTTTHYGAETLRRRRAGSRHAC